MVKPLLTQRAGTFRGGRNTHRFDLQSISSIPASIYRARSYWPRGEYIIYGYPVAVKRSGPIVLSDKHTAFIWLRSDSAIRSFTYENCKGHLGGTPLQAHVE